MIYDLRKTLGECIRKERKRQDLTQAELASRAKIENSHLSRMENVKRSASVRSYEKVFKALNIWFEPRVFHVKFEEYETVNSID